MAGSRGPDLRIVVVEGAQVADFNTRNVNNPRDLLCAISTCPHGDLLVQVWCEDADDPIDTCHPLGAEVYQPHPSLMEGRESPLAVDYPGVHGLDRT